MIPVVFDCGVLVSAIGWNGNPRSCLILIAHRQLRLCATKTIWDEYEKRIPEILAHKQPRANPRAVLAWLLSVAHFVEPSPLGKQRNRDQADEMTRTCSAR
jgi:predicted nucleic acid-binding protein